MADTTEDFIYVHERRLPYETFDADNHLYENRDAMTKFLPREYEGAIKYIEVGGRTKLAIRDRISEYIPNPTFGKVAAPGSWGNTAANHGHGGIGGRTGVKPRVMPSLDAFFDPEPRLALMKDMGIDRTLLWPTLASVLEERVADDPDVAVAVIHALNEWMNEHWSFVYSDAIFSTPIISLAAGVDKAVEELHYVHEHGAKIFLIRVAPVPTWKGRKSFALPEFDPFWAEVQRLDVVVGMHSGDPGYQRYLNEWEGIPNEMLPFKATGSPAFQSMASDKVVVHDGIGVGHRPRPRHAVPQAEVHARGVRRGVDPAVHHPDPGRVREVAGALRRGSVRGVQAKHLRTHLPRAGSAGPHRPGPPGRSPDVRLRLPPP